MSSSLGVTLFSLALAQLSVAQNSADVGNSTTTTTRPTAIGNLSFTSEPRGRGTVGLIVSCSITFAFCVWTAVHPNIIVDSTPSSRFVYKATMMLLSLIIPEGIVICAVGQLKEARRINETWQQKFHHSDEEGYLGMDGAFFVVMGGFVMERAERDKLRTRCRPCGMPCLCPPICPPVYWVESSGSTDTLTPAGFLKYLKEGRINRKSFDKREIVDKGKYNLMSKVISLCQAIWLVVNCIGRLARHLPLSLLEIHVVVQVACTLVTYFCWLNKPVDVNEPIVINLQPPCKQDVEEGREGGVVQGRSLSSDLTTFKSCPSKSVDVNEPIEINLQPRRDPDVEGGRGAVQCRPLSSDLTISKSCPSNHIAIIANACYDIIVYVDAAAASDPTKEGNGTSIATPMLIEGFIVGAVGALHIAAWNSHFPTPLERLLWRIASIGMCVFPLVIVVIAWPTRYQRDLADILWKVHLQKYKSRSEFYPDVLKHIWQMASEHGKTLSMTVAHVCLIVFCLLVLLAYLLCVIYITAESYASVRDPPAGTMVTPLWGHYWPHAQ